MATTRANLERIHGALKRIVEHSEMRLGRKLDEMGTRTEQKLDEMLENVATTIENFEEKIHKKMDENQNK